MAFDGIFINVPMKVHRQEYGDLYEDVKEESFQYGVVEDLHIPQPVKKDKTEFVFGDMAFRSALDAQCADEFAGVGRVYIKFVNAQDAQSALKVLIGWSFAGRSIIAMVLNEDSRAMSRSMTMPTVKFWI